MSTSTLKRELKLSAVPSCRGIGGEGALSLELMAAGREKQRPPALRPYRKPAARPLPLNPTMSPTALPREQFLTRHRLCDENVMPGPLLHATLFCMTGLHHFAAPSGSAASPRTNGATSSQLGPHSPGRTNHATPRPKLAAAVFALAAIPALLVGCTSEEGSDSDASASPAEETAEDSPAATEESDTEESDESAPANEGEENEEGDEPASSEELGEFFSEDEACMTVGMMSEGLRADIDDGFDSQADLDDAREAVEQTAELAPDDVKVTLDSLSEHLDTEPEALDTSAVGEDLDDVETWIDEGFCEGEYHDQLDEQPPGEDPDEADGLPEDAADAPGDTASADDDA